MSTLAAQKLKKLIDEKGPFLSVAGQKMKITSTVLRDNYLQLKCGRYGTELGGEEPIPLISRVKKGQAIHLRDSDGEAVSIVF